MQPLDLVSRQVDLLQSFGKFSHGMPWHGVQAVGPHSQSRDGDVHLDANQINEDVSLKSGEPRKKKLKICVGISSASSVWIN